jgi:hypothetical protein
MMKALIILLLIGLVGCIAEPTTTSSWHIDFAHDTVGMMDEEEVILQLGILAVDYDIPLTFSLEEGATSVRLWKVGEGRHYGNCREGKDCNVWLTSIIDEHWLLIISSERLLALIIWHEILHSYGLGHSDSYLNLMNAGINTSTVILEEWQREQVRYLIRD